MAAAAGPAVDSRHRRSGNDPGLRALSFYHTHTGKSLHVIYFTDGAYLEPALVQLRGYLSDWRNGAETDIDPGLLDILWEVQQVSRHHDTFEIISAYRSPRTNEMLRTTSSGVAQGSQHLLGTAIDVRLRGFDTAKLRDTAIELRHGAGGTRRFGCGLINRLFRPAD